ncbi:fibronectin type III domain-containing protein [Paenibacillus sp. NPDC056579]|uniref:fibronectin type III domain-containing protein n=1 Tax=Paenibacillus sp. NPDC056579 TaxID=3345871 RepID=UPI003686534C
MGSLVLIRTSKVILAMIMLMVLSFYNELMPSKVHAESESIEVDSSYYFVGSTSSRKELARYNPDTRQTEVILDVSSMEGRIWLGSNNKIFIKPQIPGDKRLWMYDTVTKELKTRNLTFYDSMYSPNYDDYTFGVDNKMYFEYVKDIGSEDYDVRIGQYDPEKDTLSFIGPPERQNRTFYGFKAGYKNDVYFMYDKGGTDDQQLWRIKLSDSSVSLIEDDVFYYGMDTSGGIYIDLFGLRWNWVVRGYPALLKDYEINVVGFYDSPEPYTIYYRDSNYYYSPKYKYVIDPTTWTATRSTIPYDSEIAKALGNKFNYAGKWYIEDGGGTLRITDPQTGQVSYASIPQYQFISTYNINYLRKAGTPGIQIVSPTSNQIVGTGNSPLIPSVKVRDPEGDTLTVSYYLDSESSPRDSRVISNTATTQQVNLSGLNVWDVSEGQHLLRFTVNDGNGPVERTIGITVDKSPPGIDSFSVTSTDTAVQLYGSASDSGAGLDTSPYRFTVGSDASVWMGSGSYTKGNLTPNTEYVVKFEARDRLGQMAVRDTKVYTKAQIPALSLNNSQETALTITLRDNNPIQTKYQIVANGQYVSQSGTLTNNPEWITVANRSVQVTGLVSNTNYTFEARALNGANETTSWSAPVGTMTLPGALTNMTTSVSQRSVTLSWGALEGVNGYDVEADGVVLDAGVQNRYEHTGLVPNSQHTYRVRAKNSGGAGGWSQPITVSTLPDPPPTPGNMITTPTQTEIRVTWDIAARTTSYELEVDGTVMNVGNTTSYIHGRLQPLTDHTYRVRAKNSGGESPWSEPVLQKTLPYPPNTPEHVTGQPLIHDITLTWGGSEGADAYEVEADGLIIDNGAATIFIHEGLDPLTGHTYRVRAKNAGGKSPWSQPLNITTHPEKPIVPGNVIATSDESEITVMWYLVPHAESYDVEIDGQTIMNVQGNKLIDLNLTSDSKHTYRVRAKNISGDSEWTQPVTITTLSSGSGQSLTNMVAVVTNRMITVSWDTVAPDAQYEVEVDGVLLDNGKNTIYNHTGLKANEFHTYKIRLKNENQTGEWVAVLSLSTLPDPPDAPTELEAFATNNSIELRWKKVDASDGYEIEVDGKTIDVGLNTNYLHSQLAPGTMHTYRVRARNITSVTAWSPALSKSTTSPTYTVNGIVGQDFNLTLLASNVQDFSESDFVVTYNPNEVEIVDLFNFTPRPDTNRSGNIPGSNLEVIYSPGNVRFKVKQNIIPGTSWSGEVTTLVFKSKIDGQASLDVIVD